jgi:WD40 repeat protein
LLMQCFPRLTAGLVVALVTVTGLDGTRETFAEPAPANPARRLDREGVPLPEGALARVGSTRLRSTDLAFHLEYSPDATLLAALDYRAFEVWDARTGKLVRRIELPGRDIGRYSGSFSADGKTMVLFDGHTVRWFDVRSGEEKQHVDVNFDAHNPILAPGGEVAAALDANESKDLVVFDLPSCKERFRKTSKAHFFIRWRFRRMARRWLK